MGGTSLHVSVVNIWQSRNPSGSVSTFAKPQILLESGIFRFNIAIGRRLLPLRFSNSELWFQEAMWFYDYN